MQWCFDQWQVLTSLAPVLSRKTEKSGSAKLEFGKYEKGKPKNHDFVPCRWILTAAHCLYRNVSLSVHLGINEIGNFVDNLEITTANQYKHPNFILNNFPPHDIGKFEVLLDNSKLAAIGKLQENNGE